MDSASTRPCSIVVFTFEKYGSCVSGSRQFKTTLFKGQLTIKWKLREKSSFCGSVFLNFRFWHCREVKGFPGGSDGKDSACNAGDPGSIPGLGRSPGEGNGNPLQFFCLENSMDRGDYGTTVHEVTKNQTQLSVTTL